MYYYRGAVDNNHVIFANFCWRIVRTTETGGVKLIYDGVPSSGQCNNTGEATSIGSSAFNYDYGPAYEGYMYGQSYAAADKDITKLSGNIIFGNDITYDENTGKYTLKDTYTLTNPSNWSTEYSTIASKYHYTCFSSSTSCQKVYYIHAILGKNTNAYYFELNNGKNHLDILKEMLDNSNNTTNSTAKTAIDTWYKNNMTSYTSQLEDTVFCNDRSYDIGYGTSGWNKDYSNYNGWLYFNGEQRLASYTTSLICPSINDKFSTSISNGNGALMYPIGLITADEIAYAGGVVWKANTSYYLYNGISNWSMTPCSISTTASFKFALISTGVLNNEHATNHGLRPVISLKKGTILSSGIGTATNPFIINS